MGDCLEYWWHSLTTQSGILAIALGEALGPTP